MRDRAARGTLQGHDARPARDRFYWRQIDGVLVVIDLSTLEFTILNRTAGAIWLCLLDDSRCVADLVRFVSDRFAGAGESSAADVGAVLRTWADLGWLETTAAGKVGIASRTRVPPAPPYRKISRAGLETAAAGTVPEWTRAMDFIGRTVTVRFHCDPDLRQSDISLRAGAFLDGLPGAADRADRAGEGDCIHCFVTKTGIFLRWGESCAAAADVSDGLSRLVLWCFYRAYGRDDFLGTFHAAALGRGGGAVLMPGPSGAGKSTLTAYLARNGWRYGGDDIVGLSKPRGQAAGFHVLPFCSAISVKAGSLDVLSPFYPGLKTLPVIRYDTKCARFPGVPVADQMTADPAGRRIGAIVFPAYCGSAKTGLVPLSTPQALLSLVGVGVRTGEEMTPEVLDGLFRFLEETPKYRLGFSSLEEARRCLEGLA